jgi:hypothetical protein
MKRFTLWMAALWLLLAALPASAHKPSDSYLRLETQSASPDVRGEWDIALRDLDYAIGLDADNDGQLTWDEVRARHGAIAAYALARLRLERDGAPCTLRPGAQLIDRHTDGTYTVLAFEAKCPGSATGKLALDYRLFADVDPQHKGLVSVRSGAGAAESVRTLVLGSDRPRAEVDDAAGQGFLSYVRHGMFHIWIGYDHILFLLSLLLPAVLVRDGAGWRAQWRAVERPRAALADVLKIVTAFTLAHSITLSLAALGLVSLPSRWVETAIALSVLLAALNNVLPVARGKRWAAAFLFGLIHGFGFASVLADLGLRPGLLAASLVGFNVGVEIGQLAIVAVFLPLAYLLRSTWFYRRVVLVGGSSLIMLVAALWMGERLFDLKLLPV